MVRGPSLRCDFENTGGHLVVGVRTRHLFRVTVFRPSTNVLNLCVDFPSSTATGFALAERRTRATESRVKLPSLSSVSANSTGCYASATCNSPCRTSMYRKASTSDHTHGAVMHLAQL